MLSNLRRFTLWDDRQRQAPLNDVAIDLPDHDYPPVTHLFFRNAGRKEAVLTWDAVHSVDWRAGRIRVPDLDAGEVKLPQAREPESVKDEVRLGRDVLDALIIDLQNRRATRANDLWLEEDDGQLLLRAADTSARAILRRLSRGRLGSVRQSALYDWKYVEFLRGEPRAVTGDSNHHGRITRLPPGEIAGLITPLPYLHAAELLILLPDPLAADTLELMMPERQLQVFEELREDQALRLLELMAPDAAADLVGRLGTDVARGYLNRLSRKSSARIVELLRYPETSVGGIMTNDVVMVRAGETVEQTLPELRERLKEPDFVHFLFAVKDDETRQLLGVVSLRDLLTADGERLIEEIMNPYMTTLNPLDDAAEAAYKVIGSHLAALPVVGHEGRLLGALTVDVAVAQVAPASWRSQAPRIFS